MVNIFSFKSSFTPMDKSIEVAYRSDNKVSIHLDEPHLITFLIDKREDNEYRISLDYAFEVKFSK